MSIIIVMRFLFIFFFVLLLFPYNGNAQKNKEFDFYASLDLNAGNYYGYDFALNTVLANKFSIKCGISRNVRVPKTIPDDFGLFYEGIKIIVPNYNPKEFQNSYEILFGRVFEFKKRPSLRVHLILGVGDVTLITPYNWTKLPFPPERGHQYSFSYFLSKSRHFIFNPRIDFLLSNFYGLSVSSIMKIGKDSHFFGIGLGHIFGKIR